MEAATMTTPTTLLTDHPGWIISPDGATGRLVTSEWQTCWLSWDGTALARTSLDGGTAPAKDTVAVRPADLPPAAPRALTGALAELGSVQRLRSPTLWEAITSGLLRRIIRAPQARALYQRWAAAYGTAHSTPAGKVHAVPDPHAVLELSPEHFAAVGAALHRKALPAAAAAYLEQGDVWAKLPATELVTALQEVSGIGPWTAACAAADFTGDYSVYPHDDLAVRTWAAKAAPSLLFPDSPKEFAAQWRRWAPDRHALHALTTYTLAWGIHARPRAVTHRS
jgi:DNA-3-methyladenine glycosylase II